MGINKKGLRRDLSNRPAQALFLAFLRQCRGGRVARGYYLVTVALHRVGSHRHDGRVPVRPVLRPNGLRRLRPAAAQQSHAHRCNGLAGAAKGLLGLERQRLRRSNSKLEAGSAAAARRRDWLHTRSMLALLRIASAAAGSRGRSKRLGERTFPTCGQQQMGRDNSNGPGLETAYS